MLQHEQPHQTSTPPTSGGPAAGPGSSGALQAAQAEAAQALAAVDDILKNALSGNSQAFLNANRQQGGQ
ncbi:MAG: hypothetical protein FJ387_31365 [Verrucomicrobia bacterium]|nr:hypothetical protein [Verrucomicrobiota bacterium]